MKQPTITKPGLLIRSLGLSLGVILLSQCSAPVSVRMEKPVVPAGVPAATVGIDQHLASVRASHDRILHGDSSAIPVYNYSVARLIEELERSGANPWSAPMSIAGNAAVSSLRGRCPADLDPIEFRLLPADTLEFHGEYSKHRAVVAGLGAPLVAVDPAFKIGHQELRKHQALRSLTAVVKIKGHAATLELLDPYQVESVNIGGRNTPMAANYSAAVMFGLSKARVDKLGLARLLRPSRYNDTAHLNFIQPYDPKRIPVLCVHGLQDTPASFAPLYFKLLEDPAIRKNYQFWVFSYPSGYPYPYSASLLRRELDKVKQAYPDHRDIVLIGHSMGGIISRTMVTDAGDKLWREAFGKPVDQTPIGGLSRQLLVDSLVFRNRPEVHRAVFIAAPHRGSALASNWVGRLGSRLVRLPSFMADVKNTMVSVATVDPAAMALSRAPNSVDTLSPNNRFVRAINKLPIASGVTYHTIAGDRGKGNTPNSSDGVVPYWSSHLDGAASEKIVPSGHMAHQNPEGIEEVRRILRLHLQSR